MKLVPLTADSANFDVLQNVLGTSPETLSLLRKLQANGKGAAGLADLNREETLVSILTVDAALALGIPFGSAEAKFSRRIVVQEYLKYKDVTEGKSTVRTGIAIRWIVNVKTLDGQAKISSVPMIAASAQMGSVEATARFQVIGMQSAEITSLIPAPTDLNTETYVELKQALMKIKDLIYDAGTTVGPEVLAILAELPEANDHVYTEALAAAWALTNISGGHSINQTLTDHGGAPREFEEVTKSVYIDVSKSSDPNARPNDQARSRARELLRGYSLHH